MKKNTFYKKSVCLAVTAAASILFAMPAAADSIVVPSSMKSLGKYNSNSPGHDNIINGNDQQDPQYIETFKKDLFATVSDSDTALFKESSFPLPHGWFQLGEKWYFFDESGHFTTGIANINGKYYYFNEHGEMQTGDVPISGRTYHFASTGEFTGSSLPPSSKIYLTNDDGSVFKIKKQKTSRDRGGSFSSIATDSNAEKPEDDKIIDDDFDGITELVPPGEPEDTEMDKEHPAASDK